VLRTLVCAFDTPSAAAAAVPRSLSLAAARGGKIAFVGVLPPRSGGAGGPCAARSIGRRNALEATLAHACEAARSAGLLATAGVSVADDLEAEALGQALARGADVVLVAEEPGALQRLRGRGPTLRRLALRRSSALARAVS
jgi:hypothetical protein